MATNYKKHAVIACLGLSGAGLAFYLYCKHRTHTRHSGTNVIEEQRKSRIRMLINDCSSKHQVILIDDAKKLKSSLKLILSDLHYLKVVGFDAEWITEGSHRKPISMLQISTCHYTLLVRLHLLSTAELPHSLIELLNDKSVIKVGVSILDDGEKLFSDYGISVRGSVDLRYLAIRYRKALAGYGLKRLTESICDKNLDKSDRLRRGNWEKEELSADMMQYAANDSRSGLEIFLHLAMYKMSPGDDPENLSDDVELLEKIQNRGSGLIHGITDVPYNQSAFKVQKSSTAPGAPSNKPSNKDISENALRSRAMYSNCEMVAPDGQLLCVCDNRKAQWYIDKGLAEKISADDDPEWKIRLKFEPRGRPAGETDFYRSFKDEICVVCGATKNFIRKNIIPREYRKHFPEILKSHSSHDVVLLCASCHKKSSLYELQLKEHFARLCEAPYKAGGVKLDEDLKRVKSAARALNGYVHRLPEDKKELYTQTVCDFYNCDQITPDVLETACNINEREEKFIEHGEKVVRYYRTGSSIPEFQKLWRQKFLDEMQPQHLGPSWTVDYDHRDYLWVKDTDV